MDVDDSITIHDLSLRTTRDILNATSPAGVTLAFVFLTAITPGCFRAARLTPTRISSNKVSYPMHKLWNKPMLRSN